jgi:hypothetical protein
MGAMHPMPLMPTPFESADLILKLYELRREETMRKARDFMQGFFPNTIEDFNTAMTGPENAYIRMVYGYWEMAASFVTNGAIDAKMFDEANGEHMNMFAKIEPFVAQFRTVLKAPTFLKNLEKVCYELPGPKERVAQVRERQRAAAAIMAKRA